MCISITEYIENFNCAMSIRLTSKLTWPWNRLWIGMPQPHFQLRASLHSGTPETSGKFVSKMVCNSHPTWNGSFGSSWAGCCSVRRAAANQLNKWRILRDNADMCALTHSLESLCDPFSTDHQNSELYLLSRWTGQNQFCGWVCSWSVNVFKDCFKEKDYEPKNKNEEMNAAELREGECLSLPRKIIIYLSSLIL